MQAIGCGRGMEAPEVVSSPWGRRMEGNNAPIPPSCNTENSAETLLVSMAQAHQETHLISGQEAALVCSQSIALVQIYPQVHPGRLPRLPEGAPSCRHTIPPSWKLNQYDFWGPRDPLLQMSCLALWHRLQADGGLCGPWPAPSLRGPWAGPRAQGGGQQRLFMAAMWLLCSRWVSTLAGPPARAENGLHGPGAQLGWGLTGGHDISNQE